MKKKDKIERSMLALALEFLHLTFKAGAEQSMYCMMHNHAAVSFNSVIAAGTTIEEDLQACPHTALMLAAIQRCPGRYIITQLSPEKLQVRSEEFQAYIPCALPETLSWPIPDAALVPVDDRLTEALRKLAPLLSADGETVLEQSIQINAGSCLATNRSVVAETWHGFDLPNGLLVPKAVVTALHKTTKKLVAFGCSERTITFHFEDASWIRTQLFQDRWPDVKAMLNTSTVTRPVPPDLFKAAKTVAVFSADDKVYVKDGLISSHPFTAVQEGSVLKLPVGGEHQERIYRIKDLTFASHHATEWDETQRQAGTYFVGEMIRGLIWHEVPHDISQEDDDIPF